VERISEEAMKVLLDYDYPGNVRELENILEHALIICQNPVIELSDLPVSLQKRSIEGVCPEQSTIDLPSEMAASERNAILSTLRKHNWNRGKAARELHINRTTLWRKIRKYGL
jgi:transcriptional regulator with PAS, ATPase and Fis domain